MKQIIELLEQIYKQLAVQKKMFTVEDFCTYTGFSKDYVYHLTSNCKIKFSRPSGKQIFFDVDDVIEFLQQNQIGGNQQRNEKTDEFILNNKI